MNIRKLLGPLLLVIALAASQPALSAAHSEFAPPEFTDHSRRDRVMAVLPEIDQLYSTLANERHIPGLVYGVVMDGELIHSRCIGLADLEHRIPTTIDTRFRIASMTKSFVAMAILRLRDAGKLSLDDTVADKLKEFRAVELPTRDSPPITIRNLMTMTTGLPEDNPWGDRQMAITREELERFVRSGLSFSNTPGETFEYSNLGFVLLGKIVSKVSGMRFQDYITRNILLPLGMKNTVWEYGTVPPGKLALGYHWVHDSWQIEPILHDGDGAAMGGLITTMSDFSRYVAFHLNAWPARNDADFGPLRRASVREMQMPRIFSSLSPDAMLQDGKTPNPGVSFYAYGLSWSRDKAGTVKVGHSGGLPGYGSHYRFAPELGIGVIAFSNLRYGPVYNPTAQALGMIIERAKLKPRTVRASGILTKRAGEVWAMIQTWDSKLVSEIAAENFLLDRSLSDWKAIAAERIGRIGNPGSVSPLEPENQLRGVFYVQGDQGRLKINFTLTPEKDPRLQQLELAVEP